MGCILEQDTCKFLPSRSFHSDVHSHSRPLAGGWGWGLGHRGQSLGVGVRHLASDPLPILWLSSLLKQVQGPWPFPRLVKRMVRDVGGGLGRLGWCLELSQCSVRRGPAAVSSLPASSLQGSRDCALNPLFGYHGRCIRGGPQQDAVLSGVDASSVAVRPAGAAVREGSGRLSPGPLCPPPLGRWPGGRLQPQGSAHSQHFGFLVRAGRLFCVRRPRSSLWSPCGRPSAVLTPSPMLP